MKLFWIVLVQGVVALSLAGCSGGIRSLDERDRSLPLMQRARAAAATGDTDGAIQGGFPDRTYCRGWVNRLEIYRPINGRY